MKRFWIFFFFSIFFSLGAQSTDCVDAAVSDEKRSVSGSSIEKHLASFLDEEAVDTILQEKQLLRSVYNEKNMQPEMVPPFAVPQLVTEQWGTQKPACLIESVVLYKKKSGQTKNVKKISRVLRAISRLKGLEYYSSSRKKMRTLYESSYVIDAPETKVKQDDPVNRSDSDFSVYALQKDLTFGEHVYRYRFVSDGNSSGFLSTNTDALSYSIFQAVKPEALQVSIVVTDLGDYLLIHGLTRADFASFSFLRKRVQRSLKTRGDAILRWFIEKYEEEGE